MARQSAPTPPQWRNRIVAYSDEPPDQLLASPFNWRIHPKAQQDALLGVLKEAGIVQNILVNRTTGNLVDGHLRVSLALREGQPTVPVTWVELSEAEEKLVLSVLDPIATLAVADKEKLDALLRDVQPESAALQQMLSDLAAREGLYTGDGSGTLEDTQEPQIDRAAELQEIWQTATGQLWGIPSVLVPGKNHRLLCGDSTVAGDIHRLMRRAIAALIVTDPPYGQDYLSNWYGPNQSAANPQGKLRNDDTPHPEMLSEWIDLLAPEGAIYVCTRWAQCNDWASWIEHRLKIRNIIIWKKNNWSAGDLEGAYGFMYEQMIFASRDGHKLRGHRLPDVWEFDRVPPDLHPTTKPVGLFRQAIEKSTDLYDVIADPFIGSGPSIAAAEQLGRIAYGCEIDPRWLAVTLQRLQDMGLTPCLLES